MQGLPFRTKMMLAATLVLVALAAYAVLTVFVAGERHPDTKSTPPTPPSEEDSYAR